MEKSQIFSPNSGLANVCIHPAIPTNLNILVKGIEGYPKGLQPEQYDCRDQTQKIQYIHEEQKAIDDLNMQTLLDDLLDEKETAFPQDREKQHIKDIELEEKIISNFLNSKGNSNV